MSSYQELLGEVPLGDSVQHTFTLTNTGDYPLGVQQTFLVSGTPLMFPVLADGCNGQVIRQGASCSVTVGSRRHRRQKDASLLIITSDPLPVTVVGISGAGAGPPAAAPSPAVPELPRWLALPSGSPTYDAPAAATLDTGVIVRCAASQRVRDRQLHQVDRERAHRLAPGEGRGGAARRHDDQTARRVGGSRADRVVGAGSRPAGRRRGLHATVGSVVRADGVARRERGVPPSSTPARRAGEGRRASARADSGGARRRCGREPAPSAESACTSNSLGSRPAGSRSRIRFSPACSTPRGRALRNPSAVSSWPPPWRRSSSHTPFPSRALLSAVSPPAGPFEAERAI